jgi:hypothetical protein
MDRFLVIMEGACIYNEGIYETIDFDTETIEDMTYEEIALLAKKMKRDYYVTGFRHVYSCFNTDKIYISDYDENGNLIKEHEVPMIYEN